MTDWGAKVCSMRVFLRFSGREDVFAFGGAEGEDFVAVVGDGEGVFPLRGQRAVAGDDGPAVAEDFEVALARVYHRLDGEGHAFF